MINAGNEAVGRIVLRRVRPVVVAIERADRGVGLWVLAVRLHGDTVKALGRDAVVWERVPHVLQVRAADPARSIVEGVGARGCWIVDRQRLSSLVHEVGKVPEALLGRGQGPQVRAPHALSSALVREREEGAAAAVVQFRHYQGAVQRETELVATAQVAVAAALDDFVGHRVERIVAKVLEDTPVP